MKLVGFVGNDFNVDQLEALGANVQHRGTFDAVLMVRPYNAHIQFDSYDENRYRPYLQLDAELVGGKGSFGNDVTEFAYREEDYLNRSVRYDFTDEELSILVKKGLYQTEFEVPALFTDTDFEIPMQMDITEVELNGNRLIYASYDMISDLQTDSAQSNYDLAEYFDEQYYERNRENDFEAQFDSQYDNQFKAQTEVEAEQLTEEVIEQKPIVESVKIEHENEIDNIAQLSLDDMIKEDVSEIKEIIGEVEKEKAPSEPVITNSGIRNATEEYDSGKANSERIMREALAEAHEREEQSYGGLTPDVVNDNPNF